MAAAQGAGCGSHVIVWGHPVTSHLCADHAHHLLVYLRCPPALAWPQKAGTRPPSSRQPVGPSSATASWNQQWTCSCFTKGHCLLQRCSLLTLHLLTYVLSSFEEIAMDGWVAENQSMWPRGGEEGISMAGSSHGGAWSISGVFPIYLWPTAAQFIKEGRCF